MRVKVRLTDEHRQWADAVARASLRNVAKGGWKQLIYSNPKGEYWQKYRGAIGEAGLFEAFGCALPPVVEHVRKFTGRADVLDVYDVRTVSRRHHGYLLHDPEDTRSLVPGRLAVLMLVDDHSTVAEVWHFLPFEVAWALKAWDAALPSPCYSVKPSQMKPGELLPESPLVVSCVLKPAR